MTVSARDCRNDYTAGSGQTTYVYDFGILDDNDITVYVDSAISTDYTVTGVGDPAGGTIVFNSAPTAGLPIAIVSTMTVQRDTNYVDGGPFPAPSVNADVDRAVMLLRQHEERLARAALLAPYSQVGGIVIDDPVDGQALTYTTVNGIPHIVPTDPASSVASASNILPGYAYSAMLAISSPTTGQTVRVSSGAAPGLYTYNGSQWVHQGAGAFSVKEFGATGDGTTDDYTAIQAAYTAVGATGGKVVWQEGTYLIKGANPILITQIGTVTEGASPYATIVKAHSTFTGTAIFKYKKSPSTGVNQGHAMRNLTVDCNGVSTHGIQMMKGYDNVLLENIFVKNVGDTASAFRFEPDPDIANTVSQTITCINCLGIHKNDTATVPTWYLSTVQESVLLDCKGWGGPTLAALAPAFHFLDCRGIVMTGGSAACSAVAGIKITTSARHSIGLVFDGVTFESIDTPASLMLITGNGTYSVQRVDVRGVRVQESGSDGGFDMTYCTGSSFWSDHYTITVGTGCEQVHVYTIDHSKVTDTGSHTFIMGLPNSTDTDLYLGSGLGFGANGAASDVQIRRSGTKTMVLRTNAANQITISDTLITEILPTLKNSAANLVTHDYGAAAADWTLTPLESAAETFSVSNASGAVNMIFPAFYAGKNYTVKNASGFALTIKGPSGSGHSVANGKIVTGYISTADTVEIYEQP